jgi:heme-degrading monooxygenase HmoA
MFSVIFEVKPRKEKWDDYLANAKMLRPQLEQIEGFVDNIRYKSLTREGWILSLSNWRDEKSVVRWRTKEGHHLVQEKGRGEILEDYHLRVGQITADNRVPAGYQLLEQRLDETEVGEGTTAVMIDAKRPTEFTETSNPADCSEYLGLNPYASDMLAWDVMEAVLTPGDLILLLSFKNEAAAKEFERTVTLPPDGRMRRVRVVRDYSMFDRREAPQYYPPVEGDQSECAH